MRVENIVHVKIERVSCGRRSYIVFKDRGATHLANVGAGVCAGLNSGRPLAVYYDVETGLYLVKNDGLGDDRPLMWGGVLLAAGLLVFYVRSYQKISSTRRVG